MHLSDGNVIGMLTEAFLMQSSYLGGGSFDARIYRKKLENVNKEKYFVNEMLKLPSISCCLRICCCCCGDGCSTTARLISNSLDTGCNVKM